MKMGDVFALDNNERTAVFTSAAHGRIDALATVGNRQRCYDD